MPFVAAVQVVKAKYTPNWLASRDADWACFIAKIVTHI